MRLIPGTHRVASKVERPTTSSVPGAGNAREALRGSRSRDRLWSARIMLRHIIPNMISPVIVLGSLEMGTLILALAGLNFLGLGVQPPTSEWGSMLNQGRLFFQSEPQLMIYPGVLISLTVLGFNLLGDGLRDLIDPRYSN